MSAALLAGLSAARFLAGTPRWDIDAHTLGPLEWGGKPAELIRYFCTRCDVLASVLKPSTLPRCWCCGSSEFVRDKPK